MGKDDTYIKEQASAISNLTEPHEGKTAEEFEKGFIIKPVTKLLKETNVILSPIILDNNTELPIVELYLNEANFCVFTTKGIYSCINNKLQTVYYKDVMEIDEESASNCFANRQEGIYFNHFDLITYDKCRVPLLFEHGRPFRPVYLFLSRVIEKTTF